MINLENAVLGLTERWESNSAPRERVLTNRRLLTENRFSRKIVGSRSEFTFSRR